MLDPIVRTRRLQHDFDAMTRLRGSVIDFEVDSVSAPERYEVQFHLRSLIGVVNGAPIYTEPGHVHRIEIRLPSSYPQRLSNEDVTFVSTPIFHPNVFTDGRVCIRDYKPSESLDRFVLRVAKYIQCDPAYTGLDSLANQATVDFFRANPALFPVDRTVLPGLAEAASRRFHVSDDGGAPKKRFVVVADPVVPARRMFKVASSGSSGGSR